MTRSKQVLITFDRDHILERIAWHEAHGDTAAAVAIRRLLGWTQPPYRLTDADEAEIQRRREELSRPPQDPINWL